MGTLLTFPVFKCCPFFLLTVIQRRNPCFYTVTGPGNGHVDTQVGIELGTDWVKFCLPLGRSFGRAGWVHFELKVANINFPGFPGKPQTRAVLECSVLRVSFCDIMTKWNPLQS